MDTECSQQKQRRAKKNLYCSPIILEVNNKRCDANGANKQEALTKYDATITK